MSYILDALRRADAERERGAIPGLSSQQHAYVEDDAARPRRPRALVWTVAALAAALAIAVGWNLVGGGGQPQRAVVEGSVSTSPPAVSTAQPAAPAPLPTTPAVVAAPPPLAAPPAATLPPTAAAEPAASQSAPAVQRAAGKHTSEPKRVARRGVEPEATLPTPATAAAPKPTEPKSAEAKTPRAEGRVYQQSELPEDVRRDLPKLVIGGASYSGDAASRMVMINGQIFHEGDRLAPQLVLERIKLKSAVLSYKGYRYEVTF